MIPLDRVPPTPPAPAPAPTASSTPRPGPGVERTTVVGPRETASA
jgi:hypothetical protein